MPVEAHLADGTVLQFPDGTDPSIVQATVKKQVSNSYNTKLSPTDELKFQGWKQQYAPKDSGFDYDLRGAFKAGLTPDPQTGHWPDTFKKPNHPTFSNQSQYAKDAPELAGKWAADGKTFIPPSASQPPDPDAAAKQEFLHSKPSPTGYGYDTKDALANTVEAARPFSIAPALQAGESAAAAMPGSPLLKAGAGAVVGAGTYFGLDSAMQKVRNLLKGSDEPPDPTDSAKNLAINEIGSRALGVVARGANAGKGALSKIIQSLTPGINASLTPEQEEMSKLSPTFAQYFGNKPLPKTLEDLFASGTKAMSIKNSGKLASEAMTTEAQKLSGLSAATVNSPEAMADRITHVDLGNARNATFTQASKQADTARLIAKGNPFDVVIGKEPDKFADQAGLDAVATHLNSGVKYGDLDPASQAATLQAAKQFGINTTVIPGKPITKTVEGPIKLTNTIQSAKEIIDDMENATIEDPAKISIYNQAKKLVSASNAKFDPKSGALLSYNPVPFDETWEYKKALDTQSGWGKNRNDLTPQELSFRDMTRNINEDIDNSIPKWLNGGKQANQAWLNSKAAVAQRNAIFYPDNAGNKLGDIIEQQNSTVPAINSILDDPKQLQRALNTGTIKFRSGDVVSTNMKRDLQAYNFIRLRDASKKLDPASDGVMINGEQLYNNWRNDPMSARNNTNLYSAQQKSDYDQLFKNISATQTKQSAIGSYLSKMYLVKGGIALAPVILGLSQSAGTAGEIAGVELGAMGLAHLMAKPDTARILVAAAGGQPLSMSEQMAARKLTAGLQGVTIALMGKDGKRTEGSFDKDGQFQSSDNSK